MKKNLFLFIIALVGLAWFSFSAAAYQVQWFKTFSQNWDTLNFQCEKQCFVLLGQKWDTDFLGIKWELAWSWVVWYGFLNGQQIVPWGIFQLDKKGGVIDKHFLYTDLPYFSQLVPEIPVVLIVQWNVSSSGVQVLSWKTAFFEKLTVAWSDFWKVEPYWYYSINLLYWPKIFWESLTSQLNGLLFFVFVILFLWFFFYEKKKVKKLFIYISILFFVLYGLRFHYDAFNIVKNDSDTFISKEGNEKIFRNYYDIYAFSQYIKRKVGTWSINFISSQEWPYPWFIKYQLWPEIQFDKNSHTVFVFDKLWKYVVSSWSLIDTSNSSTVLTWVVLVEKFNDNAYFLKR